jgi:arginase family enzyme
MVARLIHRYGVADSLFPGARLAELGDIKPDSDIFFGLQSSPSAAAVARALRDAAHLESKGSMVDFRQCHASVDRQRLDLGNLDAARGASALAAATLDIVRRGGRPVLLGGAMTDALACLESVLQASPHDIVRALVISPGLEWTHHSCRLGPRLQTLAIGTHDFVPCESVDRLKSSGGVMLSAYAFSVQGASALRELLDAGAAGKKPIFAIIDMSSIDMGHAAGADRDNVGGLDPSEFLGIIDTVAIGQQLLGVAVAHLAPERDPRGHSERLAARALLGLLDPRPQGGG